MASKYRVDVEVRTLTQKFTQGMDKIDRRLNNAGRNFKRFAGVATGAIAGIGFGALIKRTIDFGDELNKLEDKLGTSVEGMSQLKFVADQTGVAFTQLSTGLQRASRRISEAAAGTGEAKNALKELGVDAQKLNQISPDKQLIVLADAFDKVEGQSDKLRLAFKLFDTEGVKLLQTMKGGAAAINELAAEADSLGVTLTKEAAQGMTDAKDALGRLKATSEASALSLGSQLAPAVEFVADKLATLLPKAAAFASEGIVLMRASMLEALASISNGIDFAVRNLGRIPGSIGEPFRDASASIQGFRAEMLDMSGIYRDELKKMEQAGKSFAEGLDTGSFMVPSVTIADQKTSAEAAKKAMKALSDEQKAFNVLMAEGATVTASLRTPIEILNDQFFKLGDLLQAGAIDWETYNRGTLAAQKQFDDLVNKSKESTEEISAFAKRAAENMQDSFATFLFDPFDDGLKGMVAGFATSLQKMAAEAASARILDAIGAASSSGSTAGLIGQFFGGFFAAGGTPPVGKASIVGENGPELFVPKTAGTIVPNNAIGGNTYNIDARGAQRGVSQEIMQALRQTEERSVSRATAAVHSEIDRGGPLAKKIGLRA